MGREIERKFLVASDEWKAHISLTQPMSQGYLANNPNCSVRLRVVGQQAYLNIKSATLGISRDEYDYPIPVEDANNMIGQLCQGPLIQKTRYHVMHEGHLWEVDEFDGANEGLTVAEIELSNIDESFVLPGWIGREVSDQPRYYNVCLVDHPYCQWSADEKHAR